MKQTKKNLLGLAGLISTMLGIVGAVPSVLQDKYVFATGSALLMVFGLVLLAIAFGD